MSRESLHWFGVSDVAAPVCIVTERERSGEWVEKMSRSTVPDGGVYPTVVGDLGGRTVAVIQRVSPAYLRDALHYAREQLSCRRALFVGTGGTLSGSVGDFVLIGSAGTVDEHRGTVRERVSASWGEDRLHRLAAGLAAREGNAGSVVTIGTAATVPGVSWESADRLAALRDAGVDMVTMDTAHFYAACRAAGVDGLALQWATDAPLTEAFVWGYADATRQRELEEARRGAWRALPEVALFVARAFDG